MFPLQRITVNKSMMWDIDTIQVRTPQTRERRQGEQIWAQSGSDWAQMGQIRGFFSDQIQYILAR